VPDGIVDRSIIIIYLIIVTGNVMAVARWLTQHDARSSVTKQHSDVPERTTMKRAVTINRAELKRAPAVAAEATRNGLPFNSNAPRHCARLARDAVPLH
jgi:hypothetical protein